MPLSASDIVYVLSGGAGNIDPSLSTGGEPSALPILAGINNLFSDITPEQSVTGYVDYRCFYVFNNSGDETFKDVRVYIASEESSGADVQIGLPVVNESQTVTVSGTYPTGGGNFTLSYETTEFTVTQSPDFSTWVSAFQTAIREIEFLEDVTVVGQEFSLAKVFTINFQGDSGKRSHPLLTLVANNLGGSSVVTFGRSQQGSPINLVPANTGSVTVAPGGVNFGYPVIAQPVILGDLRPLEGFPVWVRRTVLPGATPQALDGFKLRVKGAVLS